MRDSNEPNPTCYDLRGLAWRIQGVAALIQGYSGNEVHLSQDECYGLGLVILNLRLELEDAARVIEEDAISNARRQSRPKP